jgi:uncharacterized protein (TIGR00730 family)
MRSVCVFCGSASGARPEYLRATQEVGALIARRNLRLIYGGGRVGLMGALADAALAQRGEVVGVIPQMLVDRELSHTGVTELRIVQTLAQRKAVMGELADAFLVLPGGVGTLDEMFEVWSWTQLHLQRKPCGLLNVAGYYDTLLQFLERAVEETFVSARSCETLVVDVDAARLIDRLDVWLNNND